MNTTRRIDAPTLRIFGREDAPTLVYLPGLHGDWTLGTCFRLAMGDSVRFVDVTYPRSAYTTMGDYIRGVEHALVEHGVKKCWLLAESWGSQIAWGLLESEDLCVQGMVLAAGFVKHPWKRGPAVLRWIGEHEPRHIYAGQLWLVGTWARLRYAGRTEILNSFKEFIARRTEEDRRAMRARLRLLDHHDPKPIARKTRVPVYYLAGLFDALVPFPLVRRWLTRNCPGYRGGVTFWFSDHVVLTNAAQKCADQVWKWMNAP